MDKLNRNLLFGFAGGLAAAAVFPFVKPVFDEVARPLARVVLKQSLLLIDRVKTVAARAAEALEDLFAEVHAEVESELREAETQEAMNEQPAHPHASARERSKSIEAPSGELHVLRDSQVPLRGAVR